MEVLYQMYSFTLWNVLWYWWTTLPQEKWLKLVTRPPPKMSQILLLEIIMQNMPNELYWQLEGCGRVWERRYGISFLHNQNCYLPKYLGTVDLVITLYQVHFYLSWPHLLYTHVCRHDRQFPPNIVLICLYLCFF